ncbi:MAG: cupin domain-containing protein [Pseudomonadota bacterium]
MHHNSNFQDRVIVRFHDIDWMASPAPGVDRKMLDRIGGEIARATTIVRFAPGSAFAAHTHDGGEEYIVLSGTFEDETGDFPEGTYVRNPPTSRHRPAARQGATIFVKLHQFNPDDRRQIHAQTDHAGTLFRNDEEWVRIVSLEPHETVDIAETGGIEVLVLAGDITEMGDPLARWDWLRVPVGQKAHLIAGTDGARLWLKTGHLAARPPQAPR